MSDYYGVHPPTAFRQIQRCCLHGGAIVRFCPACKAVPLPDGKPVCDDCHLADHQPVKDREVDAWKTSRRLEQGSRREYEKALREKGKLVIKTRERSRR